MILWPQQFLFTQIITLANIKIKTMRPTKFIFEPSTFRCIHSYEVVDPALVFDTQQHRLLICQDCSEFSVRDVSRGESIYNIKACGCCNVEYKWSTIYPEDENKNTFFYTKKDGTFGYVCPLKKW